MSVPALYTKHLPIAHGIATQFYLPGGDRDDVLQEARIALWEAARTHDPEVGPFPPFARTVIHRHLTDCLRFATRDRQLVLTESERDVDTSTWNDSTVASAVARERLDRIYSLAQSLTTAERRTLQRIVNGDPLADKQDDNRRYRLREKLRAT